MLPRLSPTAQKPLKSSRGNTYIRCAPPAVVQIVSAETATAELRILPPDNPHNCCSLSLSRHRACLFLHLELAKDALEGRRKQARWKNDAFYVHEGRHARHRGEPQRLQDRQGHEGAEWPFPVGCSFFFVVNVAAI